MAVKAERAVRIAVPNAEDGEGLRDAVIERAAGDGVLGWARSDDDAVRVHAEGDDAAVESLLGFVRGQAGAAEVDDVKPEGHEQFAARGVSAGFFVVQEHQATAHHYDLRLEVGGGMRSWAVPKEPSMDPSVKRMAIQVADHAMSHNDFEGETDGGWVKIWDRGTYEQGGRVPWPEALERGHAVFVLHGEKLTGGFALQRTRGKGEKAQWLLIKRREKPG